MTDKPVAAERKDPESRAGDAPRHDTAEMPVTRGVMRRAFRINEVFTFLVAATTAMGAVFGAYKLLLSEARAEADAGVKLHEVRISVLEQQTVRLSQDQTADHKLIIGANQKLDALLERMNVPNPAPTPKDGGQ